MARPMDMTLRLTYNSVRSMLDTYMACTLQCAVRTGADVEGMREALRLVSLYLQVLQQLKDT